MKNVCSLLCLQEPAAGTILSKVSNVHNMKLHFLQMCWNIIFPPTSISPNRSLPLGFLTKFHMHRTVTFTVLATYNATPHNCSQSHPALPVQTPYAVIRGLCSPDDGHNDAQNMLRQ